MLKITSTYLPPEIERDLKKRDLVGLEGSESLFHPNSEIGIPSPADSTILFEKSKKEIKEEIHRLALQIQILQEKLKNSRSVAH